VLKSFQEHIDEKFPFLVEKRLLVAISGGLDSVALTHLCQDSGLNISLVHCNFNLRGTESDADEAFILNLAEHLNLEVFIDSFLTEDYAKANKLSTQMAARELRYDWFYDLAETLSFDYILTAHHADDNLETFLINLSRGTGIAGLTGIPEIHGKLIRPLLPFSREYLENYAIQNNITWREDSSNATNKYLRNKIRHQVVPILKEVNPQILPNFQTTIEHLNDTADIVEESLNAVAKRAIVDLDENHITFKISEFKKVNNPKAYLYEMLKAYGFTEWNDIVVLLDAQSGKQVFSKTHRLLKDRVHLILSELDTDFNVSVPLAGVEALERDLKLPFGTMIFEHVDSIGYTGMNTIFIDKEKLKYPLTVRKWQEGDAFYPFGMKGKKKKLSKYLKDEKLSLLEKENVWLLCSKGYVVWVIGMRADDRFRVSEKTESILRIGLVT